MPAASSQLQLELHIAIEALQQSVDAAAPQALDGTIDDPTDALTKDNITWTLNRGPIVLHSSAGALAFRLPFTGEATLAGVFGLKRRNKGALGWLEEMLSEPFSQKVTIAGTISGRLRPVLKPDWHVDPRLELQLDFSTAEATLFGKALKISFRGELEKFVKGKVEELVAQLNARAAADQTLRKQLVESWNALHQTRQISESPAIWLSLQPEALSASEPLVTDTDVVVRVGASVHTKLQLGSAPVTPAAPPMPAPTAAQTTAGSFALTVPLAIQLDALHNVSPQALGLADTFETAAGAVQVKRLFLLGDAGVLYLGADIEAGSGWPQQAQGTIYLAGTPVLDRQRQELRIDDLNYELRTSDYLAAAADFLLQATVLAELRERAVFDLGAIETGLRTKAGAEIAKLRAALPPGIELDFDVTQLELSGLVVDQGWLIVVAKAEGRARMRISRIDGVATRPAQRP